MKAIILDKARSSRFVTDYPEPQIVDSDEVIIEVLASGLCATDLKMFKGEYRDVYKRQLQYFSLFFCLC